MGGGRRYSPNLAHQGKKDYNPTVNNLKMAQFNSGSENMHLKFSRLGPIGLLMAMVAIIALTACGSSDPVIQTVIVEKEVVVIEKGDTVVVTEKVVVVATAAAYGSGPGSRAYAEPQKAAPPKNRSGTLIVEVPRLPGTWGTSRPYDGLTSDNYGISDPLIYADPADIPLRGSFNPAISIVNGWKVASDGSSIIFDVRKGVDFHHGHGQVTAEDIAWSMNDALAEGNTNSRAGFVGEWMGEWVAIDSHTVKMNVIDGATLSPVWLLELSNTWRNTLTVTSKDYNLNSPEEAEKLKVGTGPFYLVEWKVDDYAELAAVDGEHYRATASIDKLMLIAMGDAQVKVAAFKTGEVDIVNLGSQYIADAVATIPGSYIQKLGEGSTLHLYMGGNFWQQTHPVTGAQLYPREGLLVDSDHPWIGDPYADGCDPENLFATVPPVKPACDNMENARLVRHALAMAIDRDAINEIVGLGNTPPAHTFTGFSSANPEWKDDWHIPYDPAAAKANLEKAGVPAGFKMTAWVVPDASSLPPDIAEAAVQFWVDELGLEVEVESTNYAGKRPALIGRSISIPFHHHMNAGYADEPKGRLVSASKGGANRGIELPNPVLDKTYLANLSEGDAVTRIKNNIWMEDYMSYWMLNVPMVYKTALVAVNARVTGWAPYTETFGNQNSFQTIVLK